MSKFIKIRFYNAKFFPKNKKSKDFVANVSINSKGKLIFKHSKRIDNENNSFKEPITVHQISNMMHTLIGERPIPSFRETFYKRNEKIFDLAKKSFLKIESPLVKIKRKDEELEVFIDENTKVNKSAWNSWSKPKTIQWFKIKKYLGDDFDEFVSLMNSVVGYNVLNKPFEDLSNLINRTNNLSNVVGFLKEKKRTPIINFLTKDEKDFSDRSQITCQGELKETIISGIENVKILDGEILIPCDDYFVEKLIKTSTNILDGGYAEIVGIFREDELNDTEDFVLVGEISDEKY